MIFDLVKFRSNFSDYATTQIHQTFIFHSNLIYFVSNILLKLNFIHSYYSYQICYFDYFLNS